MSSATTPQAQRTERRRYVTIAALVLCLAAYALLQRLPLPEQFTLYWLPLISWALVSAAIAARSFITVRRATDKRVRRAWAYMTAAAAIWCIGIVYETVSYALIDGFEFSRWPARLLYIGYPAFFAIGLFVLTSSGPRTLARVQMANLGVIGCSILICTLLVLMEPLMSGGQSTLYVAFSVLDLVIFSIPIIIALTYLWSVKPDRMRIVVLLLGLGIAMHATVNISFYYRLLKYGEVGPVLDVYWIAALMFQYWAAFEQDHVSTVTRETEQFVAHGLLARFAHVTQVMLPAAVILVILTLSTIFRDNVTQSLLLVMLPLSVLFVFFLGLRELALESHRKHLATDLQRLNSLNSHVLRVSPAAIFVCDAKPGFPVTYVSENVRALFGVEPNDYGIALRIFPEDRDSVSKMFHQTLVHGSSGGEFRIRNKSDELRWIDQRLVLKHDSSGRPAEIVGAALDITEGKELQRSVEQNQRLDALGKMSGSIAHDFNNLLTTILGFAGLLLESKKLGEEERQGITEIQAAGERGAALTAQLLSFSRRHAFKAEVVDLNALIADMRGMLERLMGDSATLDLSASPLPVYVKASKNQLEQVLMNLVLNAGQAMPDGGAVQVTVSEVFKEEEGSAHDAEAGRFAVLSVKDEGTGVAEDAHSKLFDPFYSTKKDGTGLGLATVYGIVRQHQGRIEVSNRPGGGTQFSVIVPSTSEQPEYESKASPELVQRGTERLLIVDDEAAITRVITSILQPLGYTVFTATNATEALSIAAAQPLDLVLSDIVMPDCNGRELTDQLKTVRPELKTLFMSGYTNDVLAQRKVWDGETPLIQKPLKLSHLAAVIRKTLDAETRVVDAARSQVYL